MISQNANNIKQDKRWMETDQPGNVSTSCNISLAYYFFVTIIGL